tara:strand:+ start:1416 stop:2492 length:1077 start_codon:yes stop_codon:yes gene_type:complete
MAYGTLKVDTITYNDGGSDVSKTIASLASAAPLANPTFTGTVTVPTPAANDNTTKAATTAYVQTELGDYATLAAPALTGNATAVNLTLSGNLTVNGTTTTVASTNTTLADNLIELNSGASSNANDAGILIERGSTGDNAIIAWDESADKFTVGTTTGTASSTGDIAITTGTLVANIEGNVVGNVTGNCSGTASGITGGVVAADVTVADEASDTTCNVVFTTAATGNLPPKTNAKLTFNSSTGTLNADVLTQKIGGVQWDVKDVYWGGTNTSMNHGSNLKGRCYGIGGTTPIVGGGWTAGNLLTLINTSNSDCTITESGCTLFWSGDGTSGTRTLGGRGMCTIYWVSSTVAYINGGGLS